MRVLVPEERCEMDEALAIADLPFVAAGPFLPELRRQRIVWRTQSEDQEDHSLVVADPVAFDEARLGMPAHRQRILAVRHPVPVNARIDAIHEIADGNFIDVRTI